MKNGIDDDVMETGKDENGKGKMEDNKWRMSEMERVRTMEGSRRQRKLSTKG